MKTYVALDKDGRSIVTVIARDEQEAAEKVRNQLDRPSRRAYLAQWLEGGSRVVEKPTTRKPQTRGDSQ